MPHIILEYSDNITDKPDFQKLLRELHQGFAKTGHFKLTDIKSRVVKHDLYFIGDGDPIRTFVTVNLRILSGWTDKLKSELSHLILKLLKQYFPKTIAQQKSSVTVQISDIHKASYEKVTGPGY